VSQSAGMSSEQITRWWWLIPPAVLYREWRLNRSWYLLAFAIMLGAWLLPWIGSVVHPRHFAQMAQQVVADYPLLPPLALPEVNCIVMGILAVVVFQNDWTRGQIGRVLEGPVRRSDILSAKLGFLLATLVAYALIVFIGLTVFAVIARSTGRIGYVGSWDLLATSMGSATGILALAAGTAMSNPILVGLTTAIWVVFPKIISGIIATATPLVRLPGGVVVSPPNPWSIAVDRLSPFPNSEPANHLILYALYFLVWAVFMGYRALKWWNTVPTERFGSTFFYPQLWNFYYALLALVSAYVMALILSQPLMPQLGTPFYVSYGTLSVLAWFFWRAMYRRRRRSPDRAATRPTRMDEGNT